MSDNKSCFHRRALSSIAEEVADSLTDSKPTSIKHDFEGPPNKPISFLSLPSKLRQTILLHGFGADILDFHQWRSEAIMKWLSEPFYTWYDGCILLLDRQYRSIKARALVLRDVHNLIVDDVEAVEKKLGARIIELFQTVLRDRKSAPRKVWIDYSD